MGTGGPLNIWLLSGAGPRWAFAANFSKSNTKSPPPRGGIKSLGPFGSVTGMGLIRRFFFLERNV